MAFCLLANLCFAQTTNFNRITVTESKNFIINLPSGINLLGHTSFLCSGGTYTIEKNEENPFGQIILAVQPKPVNKKILSQAKIGGFILSGRFKGGFLCKSTGFNCMEIPHPFPYPPKPFPFPGDIVPFKIQPVVNNNNITAIQIIFQEEGTINGKKWESTGSNYKNSNNPLDEYGKKYMEGAAYVINKIGSQKVSQNTIVSYAAAYFNENPKDISWQNYLNRSSLTRSTAMSPAARSYLTRITPSENLQDVTAHIKSVVSIENEIMKANTITKNEQAILLTIGAIARYELGNLKNNTSVFDESRNLKNSTAAPSGKFKITLKKIIGAIEGAAEGVAFCRRYTSNDFILAVCAVIGGIIGAVNSIATSNGQIVVERVSASHADRTINSLKNFQIRTTDSLPNRQQP